MWVTARLYAPQIFSTAVFSVACVHGLLDTCRVPSRLGEQVEILVWIKFFPQPLLSASSPADVKLPWLATLSLFSLWGLLFVAVSEEPPQAAAAAMAVASGGTASAPESCASSGSLNEPGRDGGGGGGADSGGVGKADVRGVAASSGTKPRRDR